MMVTDKIHIAPGLDATLAQQIRQQISWLIATGEIQPDELLPSVRDMARQLNISINTVRSAYQALETDGLVRIRQGQGSVVLPYNLSRLVASANPRLSHTVGVIVPSLDNPFYHPFLRGVEEIANQDRTMLFLCLTHDDLTAAARIAAQMVAKQVDGILLASDDDSPFYAPDARNPSEPRSFLPMVSVDCPDSAGYAINLDLDNAGYQATRHLLDHGYRRIGLITYAFDAGNVLPVNDGYRRALQEAGIELDETLVTRVQGFDSSAGAEGARELLSRPQPPEAIFAITDLIAVGVLHILYQAGLRVPEDMAVIGFNDIPQASYTHPQLTSVAVPAYEMGIEAMRMLQGLIAGKRPAHRQKILPTTLVIRQSCGTH